MNTIDKNRRKFHYPLKHKEYYDKYWIGGTEEAKKNSGKDAFFVDKKDIFILSAILGYKYKKKVSFKEKIPFSADFRDYASLIYGISLDTSENPSILKNEKREYFIETLIEEYACGGFEILKHKLEEKGKKPLELFEELLEDESEENDDIDIEILGPILI